jgi:hypothetical protein
MLEVRLSNGRDSMMCHKEAESIRLFLGLRHARPQFMGYVLGLFQSGEEGADSFKIFM